MSGAATLFSNARMYAVTPAVEEAWRSLLAHVAEEAGVALDYLSYPAPQPLEALWRRTDLGCVFMCGYPIALRLAEVTPIAAPVPSLAWAEHRPVYRSDLIVRNDAPFRTLEDTFGRRAGWTVEHSHSGFNAFRHHLLAFRTPERPALYGEMVGSLVTARAILDAVREGRIDVGPLDGYWHALVRRHAPALTEGVRILASTDVAPIPAFVAGPAMRGDAIRRLREAFAAASGRAWFAPLADSLMIERFVPVTHDDFSPTLAWDREAVAAGYTVPR